MLKLRQEQLDALRKHKLAEALCQNLAALGQHAEVDPDSGEVLARNGRGHVRRIHFDKRGFIEGVTSPMGRRFRMENDSEGKPLALTLPSRQRLELRYEGQRLAEVRDEAQRAWRFSYDEQGRPHVLTHQDGTTSILKHREGGLPTFLQDRLGGVTRFEYDEWERLVGVSDPGGRRTRFTYGTGRHPTRIDYPDGSVERYDYDEAGNLRSLSAGTAPVYEMAWEEGGSKREVRYADGEVLRLVENTRGLITHASGPEGEIEFTYDDRGRLVRERQGQQLLEFTYDGAGLLAGLKLPSGEQVGFGHDADMRLTEVLDWNGGRHTLEYLPEDGGYRVHAANGISTSVQLSPGGRPRCSESRWRGTHAQPLFRQEHDYDAEGRLTWTRDSERGERSFQYDAEGRLLAVRAGEVLEESFAYDACGNRMEANGETAEFDAADRLLRQGGLHCEHDLRGNLVSLHGPDGAWRFEYNARNLLVRARTPAGLEVTFGYDALGRRLWKRTASREVRYLWAGEHLVREERLEQGRRSVRDYLYLPGTHVPFAMRVDGQVCVFHNSPLGTPERLTDEFGRVVWSATCSAYGVTSTTGSVDNPLRFPGQYFDEETGLHYNRFRYYAPLLGRYLSRDPLLWLNGTHFYAYAHNDPVNRTDPLGLWSLSGLASAALGALAGAAVGVAVVALAGLSLPLLAVAAAGAAVGAVVGLGLNMALSGEGFCWPCFFRGAAEGLAFGVAAIAGLAVLAALSAELAIAAAAGLAVLGVVSTIDLLMNWEDLSVEEKSSALGEFVSDLIPFKLIGKGAKKAGKWAAEWIFGKADDNSSGKPTDDKPTDDKPTDDKPTDDKPTDDNSDGLNGEDPRIRERGLAKDPAHKWKIDEKSINEARVALALEDAGLLPKPIRRDPRPMEAPGRIVKDPSAAVPEFIEPDINPNKQESGGDFIDARGVAWDVKSLRSLHQPNAKPPSLAGTPLPPRKGGFEINDVLNKIESEFDKGQNVIIDTKNMTTEHILQLQEALRNRPDWLGRILFYPPSLNP